MSGYQQERKKIRDNVVALLRGGFTPVEDASINTMRVEPMFDTELSCINVYTRDDVPNRNHSHDVNFERQVEVLIEIMTRKTEQALIPEDSADVIAGAVEDRLLPNLHLQYPPPNNIQIGSEGTPGEEIVDRIELGPISETKVPDGLVDVFGLVIELSVTYNYETKRDFEGNAIPFVTGDVRYNLEGDQEEAEQAHDILKPEQP